MLSATKWIIILCLVYFAVTQLLLSRYGDLETLLILGANNRSLVMNGEVWRLVAALFLHANLLHILFNMYALYSIGEEIEYVFGTKKFLIVYFVSGILSNLSSVVFSNNISVGASGAIFGLLGFLLYKKWKERDLMLYGQSLNIDMKALIMVIGINIFFGLSVPGIDNYAHIGGLVSGFLLGIFI